DLLLAALAAELPGMTVQGAAAGLYVLLALPRELSERAVLAAARSRGIDLEGGGGEHPQLVIGYANLSDAAVAPAVGAPAAAIAQVRACATPARRAASASAGSGVVH